MFDENNSQKEAGKNVFNSSLYLLANVLAVGAAFFGTGPLYSLSIDHVLVFTERQYGEGLDFVVEIFWFAIVGLTTFAVARATLATAVIVGGSAIIYRLF